MLNKASINLSSSGGCIKTAPLMRSLMAFITNKIVFVRTERKDLYYFDHICKRLIISYNYVISCKFYALGKLLLIILFSTTLKNKYIY